jgi:murein DD-endopeptidase MepM/ murein hydrolase activator NlpD
MKSLLPIALMLAACLAAPVAASAQPAALKLTVEPAEPVNGSPCVFRVRPPVPLKGLAGSFMGKKVYFDFDPAAGEWVALAGVDYDAKPGRHPLALEGVTRDGERRAFSESVTVAKGYYRTTALTVPRQYVEPDAETLKRIQQEREVKAAAFRTSDPARLWSGAFAAPVRSVTTAEYGSARTYNGVRQSVHQGLDYRAATGTPVAAVNGGRVALARDLFFEGGCIVIDHGQGLMTIYMHLSEFKVQEGDRVERGQVIALSGGTGRATGPHLHLAVRWQGLYLDPATLLRLQLPSHTAEPRHADANR